MSEFSFVKKNSVEELRSKLGGTFCRAAEPTGNALTVSVRKGVASQCQTILTFQ
jgi:hypothetical protein